MVNPTPTLLQFPCAFVLKVVCSSQTNLVETLLPIICQHAPHTTQQDIQIRPSKTGQYLGLSITITANSQPQLDALYRVLVAHPFVKFVL